MRKQATLRTCRFLSLLLLLLPLRSAATYVPVAVTGFNQDIVANGPGPVPGSITADVDGANFAFVAADFNAAGVFPGTHMPISRRVFSQQTSGVVFALEPYNANNSLRLPNTTPGTLTFVTPQAASEVFVLATSGSAASPFTATITFTDASTQTISESVGDWFGGANFAIRGIGRVGTGNGIENNVTDPRLYEIRLPILPLNYGKQIASITFAKTGTGVMNVMGIAINTVGACAAPAAQPTALLLSPALTSVAISFNAPVPAADKYLIVRTPLGAALSATPANSTVYAVSATIGNGTVVSVGNGTTFTDGGLTAGTLYGYTVFAFNDLCTSGPLYNVTAPLTASVQTSVAPTYVNLPAAGYNEDIVADTAGPALSSITADVDNGGYAFMAPNFNPSGTVFPTSFLPRGGLINSATTAGLSFQLQPYTTSNSIRRIAAGSDTLTLTTPIAAADLYLLATSGAAPSSITITVVFNDGSNQAFTGLTVPDWYGGGNYAILGVGRVNTASAGAAGIDNNTANPRLYEIRVQIAPVHFAKQIVKVGITKTAAAGVLHVMGLAASLLGPCTTPAGQPVGLQLASGVSSVKLSFTAASPNVARYLIVRTTGAALTAAPVNGVTYALNSALGNGTVVGVQAGNTFTDGGLAPSSLYRYTIFAYNDLCSGGPLYNTVTPLSSTVSTVAARTYTWTGAENFTYTNPSNWNPVRVSPDPTDVLLFNNGAINAVYGIVSQTVGRIQLSNNTTALFQCNPAATLTLASDNNPATAELDIAAGSTLLSNGAVSTGSALTLAFSGTGSTATIAGTLEAYSLSVAGLNSFNFTNAVATVTPTGTLTIGGTHTGAAVSGNTTANLLINGTLNYRYFLSATPAIPIATYGTGSTVMISGFFNTTALNTSPGNMGQAFHNLVYDCRAQLGAVNWVGAANLNVAGTFTMAASGTFALGLSTTQGYNHQIGNFVQTGGTLSMTTGAAGSPPSLNVSGNFTQTGGVFNSTGASTGANVPTLHFNGTGAQTASFLNAAPVGPIVYRISNPAGITLLGTGTFAGNFNINTNGGVRISTTAANPITTALTVIYSATGTTLTYDAAGSCTATANIFPATGGPANLTVNTGSSANVVGLPFNRTVPGTLNMTSGDLNVGGNTLTLGTSATAAGTLSYTSGFIRTGTGGAFRRWFGTSGLPTTAVAASLFPLGHNGLNRSVYLYFSAAGALSAGGTIDAAHTSTPGFTNGLSVADGAYTIDTRTNSSWNFAGSGLTLTGTISMQLTGAGLFVSGNPANLRVMKAASVAGTHAAGSGQTAQRSGLVLSDLAAAHYIGAAAPDIAGVYTAINTGNWSAGTTWDIGTAPGIANEAFINPGVVVTSDAATNAARALTLLPGARLDVPAGNTVTLDSALTNNSITNVGGGTLSIAGRGRISGITNNAGASINVSAGTLNLGPANGGSMPFLQNGILSVSGGTVNINGNLNTVAASQILQTGGAINVDGNAGGVPAGSVDCNTPIVRLLNAGNTFSGGTFTIVDPHACVAGTNTFEYNNATSIAASGTHNFRVGNGTSTDPGGNASYGFSINNAIGTGKFAFWDLTVNAGTAANSYLVQGATNLGVVHDLIVNNGGEYRQNGTTQFTYIGNNLTVATGGTYTAIGTTAFANYASGAAVASTNAQTVSGGGRFRNGTGATPTARLHHILMNNAGGGVTFNIGDVPYSGNLSFTLGRIFMGTSTIIQNAGAGVNTPGQASGWVIGKFQKNAATGGLNHVYPVGDASFYTPLTIQGTTATGGDIIVSTTPGDHPALSGSLINPARSVNRYWSVSQINGFTVSAAGAVITPAWNAADLDAGTTPANLTAVRLSGSAWTATPVTGAGPTGLTTTVVSPAFSGDYAFGETCAPLAITTPPQAQTVCAGTAVTFSVSVGGTAGVLYQWEKNGISISGATASMYTIPAAAPADAGNYTVVLSSQCGGVTPLTSAIAALIVNAPPVVTTPPASQTVCENAPVSFSVAATGTGISYQWLRNGNPVTGATGSTYSIPSATPADAGSYTVQIIGTSICGNATSPAATLTVNALPLNITAATTTSFCAGGNVVLNATPGFSYQWKLNTVNITGATAASYTATASGSYTVVVSSTATGCTGTSNAISVSANTPPVSTITPAGTAAYCSGGTVTLSGPSTGGISYQWFLNGNPIPGATNATLVANATGSYTLTVSAGTGCSGTSSPTVVSMNPLPAATAAAAGLTTVCAGNAVTLNANAGTGLSYAWNLNGTPITPAATAASYAASAAGNYTVTVTDIGTGCQQTSAPVAIRVSALPTATITATGPLTFCAGDSVIFNANAGAGLSYSWNFNGSPLSPVVSTIRYAARAGGSYTVTVTDNATGCQNTSAASSVTANPLPNVSLSSSGSLSICAGGSVTLGVPAVTGQTYQWKLNGSSIAAATNDTYVANAAGSYTVDVAIGTTGCAATSASAAVTVNPLPTATVTAVGSTTACQGDTVWLNGNTGSGLSYQWSLNGAPIAGATTSSHPATANGTYTVTVTNGSNCSTTSTQTTVTINPRPLSSISYTTPVTFCEGGAVVLTAISPTGIAYQWYNNGVPMAGSTANFYLAQASGNYTVSISNSFNCATISPSILVVVNPLPQPIITRAGDLLSTGSYDTYQWYLNSLPISGAVGQSHQVTRNGGYTVRVTDANGCTNYAPVFFFNSVGLPQVLTPEMITVFPNPAHDVVSVNAPLKVSLMLRDAAGRIVRVANNSSQLDLRDLADGVYQLLVTDLQGRLLKTEKLLRRGR